jgi:riboflavin biosynthesis pyrimidine reductase
MCRLSTEDGPFLLAEESHRKGVRAVQGLRGREAKGTCGFRRTQLEGGATVLWPFVRRRLAERTLEPGLLGEMAAGGAGARGSDHERLKSAILKDR